MVRFAFCPGVLPGFPCCWALFRNCSEINSNGTRIFIRDWINHKRITGLLPHIRVDESSRRAENPQRGFLHGLVDHPRKGSGYTTPRFKTKPFPHARRELVNASAFVGSNPIGRADNFRLARHTTIIRPRSGCRGPSCPSTNSEPLRGLCRFKAPLGIYRFRP